MGFLSILKKARLKDRELRILVLGLDNAGKTTIIHKFLKRPLDLIPPTLGFNIDSVEYFGFKLNLWDVGGQKNLRCYWKNYFEKTDALIWVVDSVDVTRLKECGEELRIVLQEERLLGATVLILANKQDISGALSADKVAEELELSSIVTHRWVCEPCTVYSEDVINKAIEWLVKDAESRVFVT